MVAGINKELQRMIEKDIHVLEAIHTFLEKARLNPALKEKLTIRALRSEEDIKEGRIHDKNEVIERTTSRYSIVT